MKAMQRRVEALERIQRSRSVELKPPVDLFGKVYKDLSEADKARYLAWVGAEDEAVKEMFFYLNNGENFVITDDREEHAERKRISKLTPAQLKKHDEEVAKEISKYMKGCET